MTEWGLGRTAIEQFNLMLAKRQSPAELLALAPGEPALADDRPVNEYNRLRQMFPRVMTSGASR